MLRNPEKQLSLGLQNNMKNALDNETGTVADSEPKSFMYNVHQKRVKRSRQDKSDAIETEKNDDKTTEESFKTGSDEVIDDEEGFGSGEQAPLNGMPGRG